MNCWVWPLTGRPAAGHVQLAVRSGIRKRKRHQTARLYRVLGGFFGNDGDAQTSGHQIFDGFLIVQPRRDRQVVFVHTHPLKISGHAFLLPLPFSRSSMGSRQMSASVMPPASRKRRKCSFTGVISTI